MDNIELKPRGTEPYHDLLTELHAAELVVAKVQQRIDEYLGRVLAEANLTTEKEPKQTNGQTKL